MEKRVYRYRVKPHQIATSISFLQDQLPVIAGMTRTAKIDGHSFKNMPVYSLGGKSIFHLFDNYKDLNPVQNLRIGRDNFVKVTQFMCKKGEIRTGLSSYYVKLRDVGNIYSRMMDRIDSIDGLVGLERCGGADIKMNTKALRERWRKLEQFLAYEFRARHLKISHICKAHCY